MKKVIGRTRIFLFAIFFLAIFFRFQNSNWDQGYHLHPDERFLTMVGNAMKIPTSFAGYFDQPISTVNPTNIGFPFFVYGVFPLLINKIFALLLYTDTYTLYTIQGRILSGIADMITLIFLFKIVYAIFSRRVERNTENRNRIDTIALGSIFFYAVSTYPIQASHFFTTDTFLTMFMVGSIYFMIKRQLVRSGLFFGFAMASKISAIYISPLLFFLIIIDTNNLRLQKIITILLSGVLFASIAYLTLRISNPYYFEHPSFFSITPSATFLQNIAQLKQLGSGAVWYPPMVQWYSKVPILFSLVNLIFFGVGLPIFLLSLMGIISVLSWFVIHRKTSVHYHIITLTIISVWMIGYVIYNGLQKTQSIRYLIYVIPFFAIFAGIGFEKCLKWLRSLKSSTMVRFGTVFCIGLVLLWPVLFSTIYVTKHTRIQASEWIYENIDNNSLILSEYWDDGLPLHIPNNNKQFRGEALTVFDPDTLEKWDKLNKQLTKADYYILSSNRGWGSILTVPDKYPMMSKFYRELFNGKTRYRLIKSFCPKYYITCDVKHTTNNIINNWFEETFSVYDHPTVYIFKNTVKQL